MDLAAKCPWLDGSVYRQNEFYTPVGRNLPASQSNAPPQNYIPTPTPPSYISKDRLDLLGYDFPNMPLSADDQPACELKCTEASGCVAYVFNKSFKKCFLKNAIGTLFQEDTAFTGYKDVVGTVPRVSLLSSSIETLGLLGRRTRTCPTLGIWIAKSSATKTIIVSLSISTTALNNVQC